MADDWDPFADPADVADSAPEKAPAPIGAEAEGQQQLDDEGIGPVRPLPSVTGRRIRMLCLHGTCSNSMITRMQMASFNQVAKGRIECLYVDGLLPPPDDPGIRQMKEQMQKMCGNHELREYCRYQLDLAGGAAALVRKYDGIDECLQHLRRFCAENAPIDGVFGFSQGSNIANILIADALHGQAAELADVRFVVHNCSGIPGWPEQKPELYEDALEIPCLVIGGGPMDVEQDGMPRQWREIGKLYSSPTFMEHDSGHQPFPRGVEEKKDFCCRLLDFVTVAAGAS